MLEQNDTIKKKCIRSVKEYNIGLRSSGILVLRSVVSQSLLANVSTAYTGLFISPSGISEIDCATTNTDTAERSISIGRESLQVFFVLGALAYFQVPPLGGSVTDEKWRSQ